ncbi:unnamed protein product [Cylindrotheca closterium]|uniref:Helicase-associated domain-containing protein n=1 Tax=Cylindrotheca closterium TaxID=2856 RepID=A0AAD2CFY2_9STRA|nr:unnamed protein product [Cylindrotheca closterium]
MMPNTINDSKADVSSLKHLNDSGRIIPKAQLPKKRPLAPVPTVPDQFEDADEDESDLVFTAATVVPAKSLYGATHYPLAPMYQPQQSRGFGEAVYPKPKRARTQPPHVLPNNNSNDQTTATTAASTARAPVPVTPELNEDQDDANKRNGRAKEQSAPGNNDNHKSVKNPAARASPPNPHHHHHHPGIAAHAAHAAHMYQGFVHAQSAYYNGTFAHAPPAFHSHPHQHPYQHHHPHPHPPPPIPMILSQIAQRRQQVMQQYQEKQKQKQSQQERQSEKEKEPQTKQSNPSPAHRTTATTKNSSLKKNNQKPSPSIIPKAGSPVPVPFLGHSASTLAPEAAAGARMSPTPILPNDHRRVPLAPAYHYCPPLPLKYHHHRPPHYRPPPNPLGPQPQDKPPNGNNKANDNSSNKNNNNMTNDEQPPPAETPAPRKKRGRPPKNKDTPEISKGREANKIQKEQKAKEREALKAKKQELKRQKQSKVAASKKGNNNNNNNNNKKTSKGCKYAAKNIDKWNVRYEEAKEFALQNGNCMIPNEYEANPSLGCWAKRQRYQYQVFRKLNRDNTQDNNTNGDNDDGKISSSSSMTSDRVALLEKIGFCWHHKDHRWLVRYGELLKFIKEYGHAGVPTTCIENQELAGWVKVQRRQYRLFAMHQKSSMSIERVAMLNKVGFIWSIKDEAPAMDEAVAKAEESLRQVDLENARNMMDFVRKKTSLKDIYEKSKEDATDTTTTNDTTTTTTTTTETRNTENESNAVAAAATSKEKAPNAGATTGYPHRTAMIANGAAMIHCPRTNNYRGTGALATIAATTMANTVLPSPEFLPVLNNRNKKRTSMEADAAFKKKQEEEEKAHRNARLPAANSLCHPDTTPLRIPTATATIGATSMWQELDPKKKLGDDVVDDDDDSKPPPSDSDKMNTAPAADVMLKPTAPAPTTLNSSSSYKAPPSPKKNDEKEATLALLSWRQHQT